MKRIFDKAADLLNTTIKAKDLEQTAHNLGMGGSEDILNAGLMARSNAAHALIENLKSQKDKNKRLENLIFEQMRQSLAALNEEMDWLDGQIKTEQKAIQKNNTDIDFIRIIVDEQDLDDPDKRNQANALLKKHGFDNVEDLDNAEIMHLLQTLETDLHNDNIDRQERIETYQERHSNLRDMASDMSDYATGDLKGDLLATANRQPPEVNAQAAILVSKDQTALKIIEDVALEQRLATETSEFDFPSI